MTDHKCSVEGCEKLVEKTGLCGMHYRRKARHGDTSTLLRKPIGSVYKAGDGYLMKQIESGRKMLHVIVAEEVLGKPLPAGAVVHHVDGNKENNEKSNLVICPSKAYHNTIHMRMRAMDECGDANARKCGYCGEYDSVSTMSVRSTRAYHKACAAKYVTSRKAIRNAIHHAAAN